MSIRTVSAAGIALMHRWESCRLAAYLDTGKVPTLGWGTTRYPTGRRVQMGDTCTQEQADAWFRHDLGATEKAVDALTVDAITQPQFDALVCFTYNVGEPSYRKSSLRRLVNMNREDPGIRRQLMRWHYDNVDGDPELEPVEGLWNRRHSEADHYFGVVTPVPDFPALIGDGR